LRLRLKLKLLKEKQYSYKRKEITITKKLKRLENATRMLKDLFKPKAITRINSLNFLNLNLLANLD